MDYTLQFGQVTKYLPYLIGGAWFSLEIAFLAFCGGMVLGLIAAMAISSGSRGLRWVGALYVILFTNTPVLVQVYFWYYGLGDMGILMSPFQAVLFGMTLAAGAYLTEVLRAGFMSVQRTEMEAADTLGMSRLQAVRYVILPHIARVLFPPLSNQYIILTLSTSLAAVFGVDELTGRAFTVEAATFRSIEIFSMTAGIYIVVTLIATLLLALVGRYFFRVKMKII